MYRLYNFDDDQLYDKNNQDNVEYIILIMQKNIQIQFRLNDNSGDILKIPNEELKENEKTIKIFNLKYY
jgi:hypothetical protein